MLSLEWQPQAEVSRWKNLKVTSNSFKRKKFSCDYVFGYDPAVHSESLQQTICSMQFVRVRRFFWLLSASVPIRIRSIDYILASCLHNILHVLCPYSKGLYKRQTPVKQTLVTISCLFQSAVSLILLCMLFYGICIQFMSTSSICHLYKRTVIPYSFVM